MIRFYERDTGFHQVEFGDMVIYYSFKMPFAYKTKYHGLRIRKDAFEGYWGEKTSHCIKILLISESKYILNSSEVFEYGMNEQFKRTILEMATKVAKRGLGLC